MSQSFPQACSRSRANVCSVERLFVWSAVEHVFYEQLFYEQLFARDC